MNQWKLLSLACNILVDYHLVQALVDSGSKAVMDLGFLIYDFTFKDLED
jgi:hypothetical protein